MTAIGLPANKLALGAAVHHNVVHGLPALRRHRLLIDLASTGALLAYARARGLSAPQLLGVPATARELASGAAFGLLAATPAIVIMNGLSSLPGAARLADRRATVDASSLRPLSTRELARMLAVGIPLGVVLPEEVVFRGLLLAEVRQPAVLQSCAAFGLWHAAPTWHAMREGRGATYGRAMLATGMVMVGTSGAGVVFCWLRLRAGLGATATFHVGVNSGAMIASWRTLRRRCTA